MNKNIAVRVENLTKTFRIYDKPSDRLKEVFSPTRTKYSTDYSALRNLNFEIKKGDFVGIVGRNGAGKSTLLKILSRELSPTSGTVNINGSVSLLQLGVGFDPELTGIDNARFSSKLLGYSNKEIDKMIKEIIDFADIGEFIHHPVKTYSSGMYSRLSFAVGININPDIFIADEVLAVGDMRFISKCLRKMHEIKASGKTVILVSHDTNAVSVFCNKAIWLKDGELFDQGEAKVVAENYKNYMLYDKLPGEITNKHVNGAKSPLITDQKSQIPDGQVQIPDTLDKLPALEYNKTSIEDWEIIPTGYTGAIGTGEASITAVSLVNTMGNRLQQVHGGEVVRFLIQVKTHCAMSVVNTGWLLNDRHALPTLHFNSSFGNCDQHNVPANKELVFEYKFKFPHLRKDQFIFAASVSSKNELGEDVIIHRVHDVHPIEVINSEVMMKQCGAVLLDEVEVSHLVL